MCIYEIAQLFITGLFGLATIAIAYFQFRLAKILTRSHLYERRIGVYVSVIEFLRATAGTINLHDLAMLNSKMAEADFLFDSEIVGYMDDLYKKGVRLIYLGRPRNKHIDGHPEEEAELLLWFSHQFKIAHEKFRKYLSFENIEKV